MRNSIFCQLDSSLAVGLDHVASDIGVTLLALNHETVIAAACDDVLPHFSLTELRAVCARDLDAVLVRTLNLIFNDV